MNEKMTQQENQPTDQLRLQPNQNTQDVQAIDTPDIQLEAELPSSELPTAELSLASNTEPSPNLSSSPNLSLENPNSESNPTVNQAAVSLHKTPDTNAAINPLNPAHHNASNTNITSTSNITSNGHITSNSHHQGAAQQAMNNASNPFQAPQANLAIEQNYTSVNTSSWYHVSGRIGRLRYVAYQVWIYVLSYFVLAMIVGVLSAMLFPVMGESSNVVMGLLSIFVIVPWLAYGVIIYPKRRLNDLNISGWFALLSLIPLVNLIFGLYLMFAAGTEGANDYGDPPRENQWYHWLVALVAPLGIVTIIGILAAIAIPAYQDYVNRAQAQSGMAESYSQSDSNYDSDAAGSNQWQSDDFVINESE